MTPRHQQDAKEVCDLFLRQAAAEMSHDLAGIDAVLARAVPDPVFFVARAYRWRIAAMIPVPAP